MSLPSGFCTPYLAAALPLTAHLMLPPAFLYTPQCPSWHNPLPLAAQQRAALL